MRITDNKSTRPAESLTATLDNGLAASGGRTIKATNSSASEQASGSESAGLSPASAYKAPEPSAGRLPSSLSAMPSPSGGSAAPLSSLRPENGAASSPKLDASGFDAAEINKHQAAMLATLEGLAQRGAAVEISDPLALKDNAAIPVRSSAAPEPSAPASPLALGAAQAGDSTSAQVGSPFAPTISAAASNVDPLGVEDPLAESVATQASQESRAQIGAVSGGEDTADLAPPTPPATADAGVEEMVGTSGAKWLKSKQRDYAPFAVTLAGPGFTMEWAPGLKSTINVEVGSSHGYMVGPNEAQNRRLFNVRTTPIKSDFEALGAPYGTPNAQFHIDSTVAWATKPNGAPKWDDANFSVKARAELAGGTRPPAAPERLDENGNGIPIGTGERYARAGYEAPIAGFAAGMAAFMKSWNESAPVEIELEDMGSSGAGGRASGVEEGAETLSSTRFQRARDAFQAAFVQAGTTQGIDYGMGEVWAAAEQLDNLTGNVGFERQNALFANPNVGIEVVGKRKKDAEGNFADPKVNVGYGFDMGNASVLAKDILKIPLPGGKSFTIDFHSVTFTGGSLLKQNHGYYPEGAPSEPRQAVESRLGGGSDGPVGRVLDSTIGAVASLLGGSSPETAPLLGRPSSSGVEGTARSEPAGAEPPNQPGPSRSEPPPSADQLFARFGTELVGVEGQRRRADSPPAPAQDVQMAVLGGRQSDTGPVMWTNPTGDLARASVQSQPAPHEGSVDFSVDGRWQGLPAAPNSLNDIILPPERDGSPKESPYEAAASSSALTATLPGSSQPAEWAQPPGPGAQPARTGEIHTLAAGADPNAPSAPPGSEQGSVTVAPSEASRPLGHEAGDSAASGAAAEGQASSVSAEGQVSSVSSGFTTEGESAPTRDTSYRREEAELRHKFQPLEGRQASSSSPPGQEEGDPAVSSATAGQSSAPNELSGFSQPLSDDSHNRRDGEETRPVRRHIYDPQ